MGSEGVEGVEGVVVFVLSGLTGYAVKAATAAFPVGTLVLMLGAAWAWRSPPAMRPEPGGFTVKTAIIITLAMATGIAMMWAFTSWVTH
jgi:hypothetical protein